ncbi:MAG: Rrf2 family transcriptional regulator [Thermoguttaceae bacterium]|jgi:Rrf2 family protein|nr:Rrf2 family transcriptional regulator [Thermoguttaceae bacterium]
MKLSRTVSYALQATLQLAQCGSDTPVPCSRLAAEGKMPERFLLQILRNLVAHGILGSTRGVEGGYTLERSPEEISLLQVIEAIEGPLTPALPAGEGLPEESRIRLEQALAEVTEVARRELEAVKLAHLLPRPPSPEARTVGGASSSLPEELPH